MSLPKRPLRNSVCRGESESCYLLHVHLFLIPNERQSTSVENPLPSAPAKEIRPSDLYRLEQLGLTSYHGSYKARERADDRR